MRYFGSWDDPDAALDKWLEQKDDLLAGREPSVSTEGTTVADICNEFLFHRDEKVKQGELTQRTFDEYKKSAALICNVFGRNRLANSIKPKDFLKLRAKIATGKRPKTIHNEIGRCSVIINFANKNCLTELPIRTGTYFERPTRKELRQDRFETSILVPAKATPWGTWDTDSSGEVRRHGSLEATWDDFIAVDPSGSLGCMPCIDGGDLTLYPDSNQLHAVFSVGESPNIRTLADRLRLTDSSYLDFLVAISVGLGAESFASDACEETLEELRRGEVNRESVETLTAVFGIHESALSELVQKWTPQTMGPKVSRMELFSTEAGQVACSPELATVPRDGIVGQFS